MTATCSAPGHRLGMASRRLEVLRQHLAGLRMQDEEERELERQATSAAATTLPPPVRRRLPSPAASSSAPLVFASSWHLRRC